MVFHAKRLVVLKAIYRECFVYDSIPETISRRKTKSFINLIENGKLDSVPNMSELEMFMLWKIERGIYRESNQLMYYMEEIKFKEQYYMFEGQLFTVDNMKGMYLSGWITIIMKHIDEFLKSEL